MRPFLETFSVRRAARIALAIRTVAFAGFVLALAYGCAPRSRMCVSSRDCAAEFACVAGRCQLDKPNAHPAIDTARRLVVRPADLAYLRSGHPASETLPPVVSVGSERAILLMRFDLRLPKDAKVIEAYVVLHRAEGLDEDPRAISLHCTRIVQSWRRGENAWATQPKTIDAHLPKTVVEPGGPALVRLNVLEIVKQWNRRDPVDHGLALAAEGEGHAAFAIRSPSTSADVEPYLELYVR